MVNFGFNSASILGIVLALAGAGLYLLRSLRPEVSKDHDIFFAAVGLLCGGILLWHGWRLDPILQFSQLLLAGSAIFFAVESIRLRGLATQQARGRNSNYVDEKRPVSRVYRAELEDQPEVGYEDDYDYDYDYDPQAVPRRRLQGTAVRSSNTRRGGYEDENIRRRPSASSVYEEEYPQDQQQQQRPRSTRPTRPPSTNPRRRPTNVDVAWEDNSNDWEDGGGVDSRNNRDYDRKPRRPESPNRRPSSSKRRPKSADDIVSNVGTEYVDYQPFSAQTDDPTPPSND